MDNSSYSDIRLESVSCPLCENSSDDTVLKGHDRLHNLPGEFTVVRCQKCGLMRTNPRPVPETIGFYYPEDYGPYLSTTVSQEETSQNLDNTPRFKKMIKELLKPIYRKLVQFNTTPVPSLPPGRMLEVGCASGSYLHIMAQQGWQVEGIEYSSIAADRVRTLGYKVHVGPLETAPDPDKPFDLIVGWMVLEHLHDPLGSLKKMRQWARPGTRLVLSVPNAGSAEFSFFKSRWYALQLPNHLYHFTPATMKKMLNAAGWEVERIYHQRILSNLIASLGYFFSDHNFTRLGQKLINFPEHPGKYGHLFLYPLAWLLSKFAQTGRMVVWARIK